MEDIPSYHNYFHSLYRTPLDQTWQMGLPNTPDVRGPGHVT